MGDLARAGQAIRHCFIKDNGKRFYGCLLKPPMSQTRTSSFFNPRRILKVDRNQDVQNGDIFKLLDGEWGLCFDNTEGYYRDPIYRTFGVVVMDHAFKWQRRFIETDTLTKTQKTVGYKKLGILRCAMEFIAYNDDSLKIPQPRYRIVCGKNLMPGDLLDDQITVQHVERVMGVTIAYVRGKVVGKAGEE